MMTHTVLIIGAGSIGERHLRCFAATGRARVLFCEPNETVREAVARRYPFAAAYADLDAAMAASFDAAVIATPAPLHVPLAEQLASAGKHLLIEKPLSTTLDGTERLAKTVRDRGIFANVAYVYRAHPALEAMKQAIDAGRFGRPLALVAVAGQHFPTNRPAYSRTYYTRHETGGGAVQDALTHVLNAGQWLAGPITSVVADLAHQALEGTEVEDTAHVLARHGTLPASYCLNQYQAPDELSITVICERGTARFDFVEHRWRWMIEPGGQWHEQRAEMGDRDSLFIRQANLVLDGLERRSQPRCSLEEAVQTLRANLAILDSARAGTWQTIAQDVRRASSSC